MSYSLVGYNAGHYNSYEDAKASEATYETGSSIDALEGRNGFLDVDDILTMFKKLVNDDSLIFGVVNQGRFIEFDDISNHLNENENVYPDEAIEHLTVKQAEAAFESSVITIIGVGNYSSIMESGGDKNALIHAVGRAAISDRTLMEKFSQEFKDVRVVMNAEKNNLPSLHA